MALERIIRTKVDQVLQDRAFEMRATYETCKRIISRLERQINFRPEDAASLARIDFEADHLYTVLMLMTDEDCMDRGIPHLLGDVASLINRIDDYRKDIRRNG